MKIKIMFFITLVLLITVNVFSHDKGDFMLYLEPQFSLLMFSDIGVTFDKNSKGHESILGGESAVFDIGFSSGFGIGFKTVFCYYFLDFMGVSTGLGFDITTSRYYGIAQIDSGQVNLNQRFGAFYYSIPLGLRFSFETIAFGTSFTYNVPLIYFDTNSYISSGGKSSSVYDSVYYIPYIGLNIDFGFSTAGRKGKRSGFGMSLRYSTSLSGIIAYSEHKIKYDPLRYQGFYVVIQPAIQLTNFSSNNNTAKKNVVNINAVNNNVVNNNNANNNAVNNNVVYNNNVNNDAVYNNENNNESNNTGEQNE